jgi:glycosyltransferase involved in cell wall biosynthesis
MRVAMMISGADVNGAVVHCLLLTRYLTGRGHRVLLLHRPQAWIARQAGLEGVELFETGFSRAPRELIRVARRLNDFDAEVVHTHMSSAHTYGALARVLTRRPVVATAHATHLQLHWPLNNLVIATSAEVTNYHRRVNLVRRDNIITIPNFIDQREFVPADAARKIAMRAKLDLPADAFVIGCVGDIGGRKRQADLVDALARLAPERPEARLLLAGGQVPRYTRRLRAAAAQAGVADKIQLIGQRADIADVLAALDVFVMASQKETGPIAVLEAMAMELPVISTDVGTVAEFVVDGTTGHVVEIGDTAAIARHVLALADNPAKRAAMGRAARARLLGQFTLEKLASRVEQALMEVAARGNRPPLAFIGRRLGI